MNKNIMAAVLLFTASTLGLVFYYYRDASVVVVTPISVTPVNPSVVYRNTQYGFDFFLPDNWQGYSVVSTTWQGTALVGTATVSGHKLLIRNPKWTTAAPYEDLPVLIFTVTEWEAYQAGTFSISAAPFPATQLARNSQYVFALPPRWDFDYSLDFAEAQAIMASTPLKAFEIAPLGKLNMNVVCDEAVSIMKFMDTEIAATYRSECLAGGHPGVIDRYKATHNLNGDMMI